MKGFIPWFKKWGPITWGMRTVPPWNYVADWPNIDQSGLGYLEKIMAEVCWGKTQMIIREAMTDCRKVLVTPTADRSVAAAVGGGLSSATTEAESARDLKDKIDGYQWYAKIVWHLSGATCQGDGLRPARLIRKNI